MIQETRIFNISSRDGIKKNGTLNSIIDYYLPNFVNNQNDDEIVSAYLSIKNVQFPSSFYLINDNNNTISINNVNYTLTKGNYNVKTFITSLKALLGVNYTIIYDSITYKITITNITSFTINISKTTMTKFLGISSVSDITSVLNNGVYVITSNYVVNFLPIQRICLKTNISFENYDNRDKSNDLLLSIQNNANIIAGNILYTNDTSLKYLLNEKDISNFSLRITDEEDNTIDFNNCNWNITFEIDYIYRSIPIKNNLGRFIRNNNLEFVKEYIKSLEEQE
jgi:hypothetical protein